MLGRRLGQWCACLAKSEDPSLTVRTHKKGWAWSHEVVRSSLGKRTQRDPQGGLLTGSLLGERQSNKRYHLKGKVGTGEVAQW